MLSRAIKLKLTLKVKNIQRSTKIQPNKALKYIQNIDKDLT